MNSTRYDNALKIIKSQVIKCKLILLLWFMFLAMNAESNTIFK